MQALNPLTHGYAGLIPPQPLTVEAEIDPLTGDCFYKCGNVFTEARGKECHEARHHAMEEMGRTQEALEHSTLHLIETRAFLAEIASALDDPEELMRTLARLDARIEENREQLARAQCWWRLPSEQNALATVAADTELALIPGTVSTEPIGRPRRTGWPKRRR